MVAVAKTFQDALGAENHDHALRDLLDLARDNSIPARNRLVERLGDLYFEASPANSAERELMAETVRSKLAQRFAADPNAPAMKRFAASERAG